MNYAALRYEASLEAGYQFSTGNATIKTWLGPDVEYMCITPADLKKSPNGTQWGAKGGLDAWMPLGESVWLAADGSIFPPLAERYSASVRLGYQPLKGSRLGFTIGRLR